jgi:nucleotide-binding universal stress UspA family protein
MSFPFKKILCPVDFDESSEAVLAMAAKLASANDGIIYVLHVVPMTVAPTGMPVYVDIYKGQEEAARNRLRELAHQHLSGVKYELITHMGAPIGAIIQTEKQIPADVVLMGTHGRRGFAHVFLGSVAEAVVRQSYCPVLTIHSGIVDQHLVGHWMTANPVTADPTDNLAVVQKRMAQGKFRSMPVLRDGHVIGIITDRDIRQKSCNLEKVQAETGMTREVLTVTPQTSVWDAARLLSERKIGGMPVVDDHRRLLGIVTTTDLLHAFVEMRND